MSLTIHTAPRPYLPPSDHAITKRVMSMLQDARSFPEQRDALLRVYYPYIRREKPPMFMADPAKHFAQHVIRDGHLSVTMDLDHLRKAVYAAVNVRTRHAHQHRRIIAALQALLAA